MRRIGSRVVISGFVADLIRLNVDVIVTTETSTAVASKKATMTVPIVTSFAGFSMSSYDPALRILRSWLDWWVGIGHVVVGMHRQDFDLQLTQYDERGWRATFYVTGVEHSPTSATGTGWERTPWHAKRQAAWKD